MLAQEQADRAAVARAGDRSLRWVAQQQLAGQGPSAVTTHHEPNGGAILGPQAMEIADLGELPSAVDTHPGERPEA